MSDDSFILTRENLAHTSRVYLPDFNMQQKYFFQVGNATSVGPRVLLSKVPPQMPHRKIWSFLYSGAADAIVRNSLVAELNGREVFRWQMTYWRTQNASQWFIGWGTPTNNTGGHQEGLTVNLAGTTQLQVSPLVVNLTCDTIFMDSSASSSALGLWDGYLFCLSQTGV